MKESRSYGVILPHFGSNASRDALIDGAVLAEQLGFSAVWVRDHLVYRPHGSEDPNRTHFDTFVALTAVAVRTDLIKLGTASLIPHRNPIHTAQLVSGVTHMAGPDRFILGVGLGSFDHEFDAAGKKGWDRRVVLKDEVEIFKKLWKGKPIDHDGEYYQFKDVDIVPSPAGEVPIWYCGSSKASVRRTVEYCNGWIAARMPRRDMAVRLAQLQAFADKAGVPRPPVGVIPYVVPGATREEAEAFVNLEAALREASKKYSPPASGRFETLQDLEGSIMAGAPADLAAEIEQYHLLGVDHFVFDLRLRFDSWLEVLQDVGENVLPLLRRSVS